MRSAARNAEIKGVQGRSRSLRDSTVVISGAYRPAERWEVVGGSLLSGGRYLLIEVRVFLEWTESLCPLGGFSGLLVWANLRIVADSGSSDVAGLF